MNQKRLRPGDVDGGNRCTGVELDATVGEVSAKGLPEAGIEVGGTDVEDEAFAGAEEVDVEHRRQFGRRQSGRHGEETPREYFEGQVPRRGGEVDVLQERLCVDVVESAVDVGHRHRRQRGGGAGVDADEVGHAKCRAAQRERERVPRRGER